LAAIDAPELWRIKMTEKTTKTKTSANIAAPVERIICRWWQRHIDTKWEDFATAETGRGKPILIQEKRCTICGRAKRRVVYMD